MKNITDKIFEVIEALKANGTIRFYADVYHILEMDKGNFNAVKNRNYDFTVKQLFVFIHYYNVNANFVFRNDARMFGTNVEQKVKKTELSLFSNN
tara:strand:+ start:304 stop:588 length:285 start_codon:yes stop_codon:yes gene_type:complete